MKTPREILLEQHQAAATKLDAIRRSAVAAVDERRSDELAETRRSQATATNLWRIFLRELIFPSRRIWAGLATAWLLIFVVNFSLRDHSPTAARKSAAPEIFMSFRQQQRLLAELTGPDDWRVAEPPKKFSPRPRTETAQLLTA